MSSGGTSSRSAGMRIRLLKRGQPARSYRVRACTVTIGSGKEATIRAAAAAGLAPVHALVWLDGASPTVVPAAGCTLLVNGRALPMARLGPDDVVTLGSLSLCIDALEPAEGTFLEPQSNGREPDPTLRPDAGAWSGRDAVSETAEWDAEPTLVDWAPAHASRPPASGSPPGELPAPPAPSSGSHPAGAPLRPAVASALQPEVGGRDEDEEDDDDGFVEPFSLVDHLETASSFDPGGVREKYVVAQVVRHSAGRVWRVVTVLPGQTYEPIPGEPAVLRMGVDGTCVLNLAPGTAGNAWLGGQELPLGRLEGSSAVRLGDRDRAIVDRPDGRYIVQVLRPPRAVAPSFLTGAVGMGALILCAIAVTGLFGGGALALESISGREASTPLIAAAEEEFAPAADVTLIAPPAPPEPVEEDQMEPADPSRSDPRDQEASTDTVRRTTRRRGDRTGASQPSATQALLSALRSPSAGAGAPLRDVITTIDAAPSSSTTPLFGVGGILGRGPGNEVRIAPLGDGARGVITIGGEQIRAGRPSLGALEPTGRRPETRGRVTRGTIGGPTDRNRIDPGAVADVIDRNIGRITRCYERRLLTTPDLSGRIVFDWTVTEPGGVSNVRVRASSVPDSQVATCIGDVIRSLRFPRPRGGPATVSFPFVFRAVE